MAAPFPSRRGGGRTGSTVVSDQESWLAQAVVSLTAMTGERFNLEDFAQLLARASGEICSNCEVGVVLAGSGEKQQVSAGSTLRAGALEVLGLRLREGAAVDALRSGLDATDRNFDNKRWRSYSPAARQLGYTVVHTIVLLRDKEPIGAIDVYTLSNSPAPRVDLLQSLAQVAAAHVNRELELQAARLKAQQLEGALQSRVQIEQAKGIVGQHYGAPLESAFGSLRRYARSHGQGLDALCQSINDRQLDPSEIPLGYDPMSALRRSKLREIAIERWLRTSAESTSTLERALGVTSRSVEARVELEHSRALRELQAIGRAVDRHFRDIPATPRPGRPLPVVLVGTESDPVHSFVVDTLSPELRISLALGSGSADTIGGSIVDQPDLVILGTEMLLALDADASGDLHRYCPDSRMLVVVENGTHLPRPALPGVDAVLVSGDAPALVAKALELCGVRERRGT
jgi:hypothetical protein